MLSSRGVRRPRPPIDVGKHGPQHDVGEVTLQAAEGFKTRLALGDPPCDVRRCARVGPSLDEGDRMKRAIELPVPAPVEAMSARLARGGRNRGRPAHERERGGGADATWITGLAKELRGCDGGDPGDCWQARA